MCSGTDFDSLVSQWSMGPYAEPNACYGTLQASLAAKWSAHGAFALLHSAFAARRSGGAQFQNPKSDIRN